MSGNLAETSFIDLIQFYSISRQTAAVTIVSPAGPEHNGILYIEGGDVVNAQFGELTGVEAVRRALRLKEGEFHVELNVRCPERTIFEPWGKLVLEEMVSDDEALSVESANGGSDRNDDFELDPLAKESSAMIASESKEGPRYCPVCNRRYMRGTVCTDDSAQLVAGAPPASSRPTPRNIPRTVPPPSFSRPPEKSSRGPLIGGVIAVVLIGGAAAAFLYQRSREQAAQQA